MESDELDAEEIEAIEDEEEIEELDMKNATSEKQTEFAAQMLGCVMAIIVPIVVFAYICKFIFACIKSIFSW
jgi:uncharacterized membrane protein (DUF106 family)